jgi:hypothetical protein
MEIFSYFSCFKNCKKLRPGFATPSGVWCLTHTKPTAEHIEIQSSQVQSKHFKGRGPVVYATMALPSAFRYNNVAGGFITLDDTQIKFFNILKQQTIMSKKIFALYNLTAVMIGAITKEQLGTSQDGTQGDLYDIYKSAAKGEVLSEAGMAVTSDPKWPGVILGFQKAELAAWQASTDFPFTNRETVIADESVSDTIEAIIMLQSGNPTAAGTDAQLGAETLSEVYGALLNPEAYATSVDPAAVAETLVPTEPATDAENPYTAPLQEAANAPDAPATEATNLPAQPSTQPDIVVGQFGMKAADLSKAYEAITSAVDSTEATLANLRGVQSNIARTAIESVQAAAAQLDAGTAKPAAIPETVDAEVVA